MHPRSQPPRDAPRTASDQGALATCAVSLKTASQNYCVAKLVSITVPADLVYGIAVRIPGVVQVSVHRCS
jgi:hypothetical protein